VWLKSIERIKFADLSVVFNAEPSALDLQIFDNLLASRALTPAPPPES
jgi:hypothetical protein